MKITSNKTKDVKCQTLRIFRLLNNIGMKYFSKVVPKT